MLQYALIISSRELKNMNDLPPISKSDLHDLFSHLNPYFDCSHTFSKTKAFLEGRKLPVEETVLWLGRHGLVVIVR